MKVFIYPTFDPVHDKSGNNYIRLFREAFEKDARFKVLNRCPRSETLGLILNADADMFILHWADLVPSKPLGWLQSAFFRIGVNLARSRGKKIVWVLHNKTAHDDRSGKPEKMMDFMASRCDRVLTHSLEGVRFFKERFPASGAECRYIPHPVYSETTVPPAEREYDYIIWGGISKRKRVLEFIRFAAESDWFKSHRTLICGRCSDQELDSHIREVTPPWITYENAFLSDDELRDRISKAGTILFTYDSTSVLSSGALVYSLNFVKPIIGPAVGSFADMKGIVSCYHDFKDIPDLEIDFDRDAALGYIKDNTWARFTDRFVTETQD